MTDEELAQMRFTMPAAGIKVVFIPQCAECAKNIEYFFCEAFEEKPEGYMTNERPCPEFEQE